MKKFVMVVLLAFAGISMGFAQDAGQLNVIKPLIADKDLVIPLAEISENAVFYPVDVDGTRIEVLAVKAPDGTIRTAFNTCQSCFRSGRGFYKQDKTSLVCQNCGNRFRMNQVQVKAGGCNPVPIYAEDKTVDETAITIPLAYLRAKKNFFARWKRS
jgi:uncharacterized membrane protein